MRHRNIFIMLTEYNKHKMNDLFPLMQESADEVIDIFSQSEPSELVHVCASPSMIDVSPARTLRILQNLEDSTGVSVPLTITMATMMLRLGNIQQYTQLMERHSEVRRDRACCVCSGGDMLIYISSTVKGKHMNCKTRLLNQGNVNMPFLGV